jgi:hypothetical protein
MYQSRVGRTVHQSTRTEPLTAKPKQIFRELSAEAFADVTFSNLLRLVEQKPGL